MEISGKGLFHFYQQPSSLKGNQTNYRTNVFCQVLLIQLYESDYKCIRIVIYGRIRNVPLNILSSVYHFNSLINLIIPSTIIDDEGIRMESDESIILK